MLYNVGSQEQAPKFKAGRLAAAAQRPYYAGPSSIASDLVAELVAVPSKGKGQYALICPAIGFHPTRVQYSTVAAEESGMAPTVRVGKAMGP
jgi:hypothetical protein